MVTCNRCGIRFDPSTVALGADCLDCQEVEGELRPSPWRRGSNVSEEDQKLRDNDIIRLTLAGKTVNQISRQLGISGNTVSRYRTKLKVRNPRIARRNYDNRPPVARDFDSEFALSVEADMNRKFSAAASAAKLGVASSTILDWRRALLERRE